MVIVSIEAPYFSIQFQTLYLVDVLGADPRLLGLSSALSSVIAIFSPIAGGHISNRIGLKRAMLVGQLTLGASVLAYIIAATPESVLPIMILAGLVPIYWPARDMYILSFVSENMKGKVVSLQNLFFSLAVAPAPSIGGLWWVSIGPRWVFGLDLVLTIVASILTLSLASLAAPRKKAGAEAVSVQGEQVTG
jgi:MFS family permease